MRQILTALILLCTVVTAAAQEYQNQISLIRPRPENCLVYGPITFENKPLSTDATISLIDPATLSIVEKIPVDQKGWYLFSTVKKGHLYGLMIEKEGLFPYYHEFQVAGDFDGMQLEKPLVLPADLRNIFTLYYTPLDTIPGPLSRAQIDKISKLLSSNHDLSVSFDPMGDTLDAIRINLLTSRFINQGMRVKQLASNQNSDSLAGIIRVEIKAGLDESGITVSGDAPLADEDWTIQFAASRSKMAKKSFKGLEPIHEFRGKDGFYRYTYGTFSSRDQASQKVQMVKKKGFSQAFPKTVASIKKL